jgi:hypothetical protein
MMPIIIGLSHQEWSEHGSRVQLNIDNVKNDIFSM